MSAINVFLHRYGTIIIFGGSWLEQSGLPLPATPLYLATRGRLAQRAFSACFLLTVDFSYVLTAFADNRRLGGRVTYEMDRNTRSTSGKYAAAPSLAR